MFYKYRLISSFLLIYFSIGLTGCLSESSSSKSFSVAPFIEDSSFLPNEKIPEEVEKATYNGDMEPVNLTVPDSCDGLKERIILAWEQQLSDKNEDYCLDCSGYAHLSTAVHSEEMMEASLVVDNRKLVFIDGNDLHTIEISDTATLNEVGKLVLDFVPVSIYLNKTQNTVTVFGFSDATNEYDDSMMLSLIDVSDLTSPVELERYSFKNTKINPLAFKDGEIVLVGQSNIALPRELILDKDFQKLSENYRDAKHLKELYDYAVENTDGTPPQALLDFQEGADVLVTTYQTLFNTKFDSVVGDINELLPSYQLVKDGVTETHSMLSCQGIYTNSTDEVENTALTHVIHLSFDSEKESKTFGLQGDYLPVSYDKNRLILLSNDDRDPYKGETKSTLTSFSMSDAGFELESSTQLHGIVESDSIKVFGDNVYLLSIQLVSTINNYHSELGMINFVALKATDTGFEKISEEPNIASSWGLYLDGRVAFMRDGLIFNSYSQNQQVFLNYMDPLNLSVSTMDSPEYISSMLPVDETRLLISTEDYQSDYRRSIQLLSITGSMDVTGELNDDHYYDLQYLSQVLKLDNGYLIGSSSYDYEIKNGRIQNGIRLLSVNETTGLTSVGNISYNTLIDDECMSDAHGGHHVNCDYYAGPFGYGNTPRLGGVIKIDDKEYVISFNNSNLKLNQINDLSKESEISISH